MEPKTWFATARHQRARLEYRTIWKWWQWSFNIYLLTIQSGRFRDNRFRSVLSALSLPTSHSLSLKCLDPGSLRAGGATWLMQITDNGEQGRRRGRWQSYRTMKVYIQEVSSLFYLQKVPLANREKVLNAARCFTQISKRSAYYIAADLPTNIWFVLFSSWKMPWANGNNGNCEKEMAWLNLADSDVLKWPRCNYCDFYLSKPFTKLCHVLTQLNEKKVHSIFAW